MSAFRPTTVRLVLPASLTEPAQEAAERLKERGETIAIAESSAGGLIAAALLAVPGASAYFTGGVVFYTRDGVRELLGADAGPRSASEPFARAIAQMAAAKLGADWGVGETGAAGPSPNPYGDPAGHTWVAVHGPRSQAAHVLTGDDDRAENMERFAAAALELLAGALG